MSFKSIWLRPSDCAIVNYPLQTTTTLADLTFLALRMTGSGRNSSCSNRLALGLKTSSPGTVAKCNSRSDMLISAAITGSGGDSRTDSSEKSGANTIRILVKNSKNFFSSILKIWFRFSKLVDISSQVDDRRVLCLTIGLQVLVIFGAILWDAAALQQLVKNVRVQSFAFWGGQKWLRQDNTHVERSILVINVL